MALRGFEVLAPLGHGQFGDVLLVRRTADGPLLAAKLVRGESAEAVAAARREAALLRALRHLNVVRCVDVVQSGAQLAIVMEYASGGDLDGYIRASKQHGRGISEGEAMRIFIQVALALDYLHERRVMHRDLKPKNILLDCDGVVKVSDFGVSKSLEHTGDGGNTVIGTPYYMAPEVLEGNGYDSKCDVWSLGCVLYEIAAMSPPFVGSAVGAVVYQILEKQPPQLPERFSQEFHDLVNSLLTKDPSARPDVQTVLRSSFVQGHIMRLVSAATFSQPQMIEHIDEEQHCNPQHQTLEKPAVIPSRVTPLSNFLQEVNIEPNWNERGADDMARQIFFENKAAAKKNREQADDERCYPGATLGNVSARPSTPATHISHQRDVQKPATDACDQYAANARAAQLNKRKILEDLGRYDKTIDFENEQVAYAPLVLAPPEASPPPLPQSTQGQTKDEYAKMLEAERLRVRAETKALQERMRALNIANKEGH